MKFYILILISLFLVFISGCSSTNVAVLDNKNPIYEDEALIGIDFAHWKTHEGEHYYKRDWFTLSGSSTMSVIIYTSNETAHMLPQFIGNGGAINVTLYSNTTVSNNGTLVPYFNSNFNYPDTNGITMYRNPTIINNGIFKGRSYAGQAQKIAGEIRGNSEIILAPNSVYMFKVTNQAATSNIISCNFDWYDD